MKRFGFVIRIDPAAIERYREYDRDVWPAVLETIRRVLRFVVYVCQKKHKRG
jgi:L-rhamnose mutarotase